MLQDTLTSPGQTLDWVTNPADPSDPMQAELIVLAGTLAKQRYPVEEMTLIGRDPDVPVLVPYGDVSRRHACIKQTTDNEFILEDLKSRNGTLVNGAPIEVQVLKFGDRIQIGQKALFLFAFHSESLEDKLIRWQHNELIAQMTSGLIHDFNNYMTAILGYTEYLQDLSAAESLREVFREKLCNSLEMINGAVMEGVNLTRKVVSFAKDLEKPQCSVTIGELVESGIRLVRKSIGAQINIEVAVQPNLQVVGNRSELLQVFINLLLNARDALPNGGTVRIEAGLIHNEALDATEVEIQVQDTGVGMDEVIKKRVFEPLFTTKAQGRGTGLGLSTVSYIIEKHSGRIHFVSTPGLGTTVSIFLPQDSPSQAKRQARPTTEIAR
jgi:signal transduction histidine kinase